MADTEAAFDPELYERDEYAWIEQQIQALSNADWQHVDRLHLIEYLTDMAKRERRELRSRRNSAPDRCSSGCYRLIGPPENM